METQTIHAQVRKERGKGPARQLRARGMLPAVCYGGGGESVALSISPKELVAALSTPWKRNALIRLDVDGTEQLVLVADLEVHPVGRDPLHVDFKRVQETQLVDVHVPLSTRGRAAGVQKGGVLRARFRDLPVRTQPNRIPPFIEVDVTALDLNQSITVADIPLPEGVEIRLPPRTTALSIAGEERRKGQEEAGEGEEAAAATT